MNRGKYQKRLFDEPSDNGDLSEDLREKAKKRQEELKKRREERAKKRKERWNYRIQKIQALTAKAYAVATKRKWLVFMLGLGLIIFLVISSGGLGGFTGILDKLKSFF